MARTDIVILCPQCNREAGRRTDYRMKCLDRQFRDPKICQRIVDKNLVRVRSMDFGLIGIKQQEISLIFSWDIMYFLDKP